MNFNRLFFKTIVSVVILSLFLVGCTDMDDSYSSSYSQSGSKSTTVYDDGTLGDSWMDDKSTMVNSQSEYAPANTVIQQAWNMMLVNAKNPLPEGFYVETTSIKGYENRLFDTRAANELESLLKAAEAAGYPLYLVSAYRTPDRQAALFLRKVQSFTAEGFSAEEAEKQAAMWVARPYTSEHNLGLAADIVSANWYETNNDLTAEFDKTAHYQWLYENCADYGFILRYPKGKESITGVTYEPWHYRYVGVENARKIMESKTTLEEYTKKN